MKPDIFLDDFSRTAESDAYYAVLGRALAFATRFEANCRSLATIIAIRMNPEIFLESPERQSEFVQRAGDRALAQHLNNFAPLFADPPGLNSQVALTEAREARNEIAHETALGVIDWLSDPEYRKAFLQNIERLMRVIALGDRVVSVALSSLTHEPLPTGQFLGNYENRVAAWVGQLT